MLLTPGDCLGYLGVENRSAFHSLHPPQASAIPQRVWMKSEWTVSTQESRLLCRMRGDSAFLLWNRHRDGSVSWRLCTEEEKDSSGHGGFLLDRETSWLDDAKDREVRLFAWAGWMHRNNLMHVTQHEIAVRLKHVPKASSDDYWKTLWILGWV